MDQQENKRAKVQCKYCNHLITKVRCPYCKTNNKESFIELMEIRKAIEDKKKERKEKEKKLSKQSIERTHYTHRTSYSYRESKRRKKNKEIAIGLGVFLVVAVFMASRFFLSMPYPNFPEEEYPMTRIRVLDENNNDISNVMEVLILIPNNINDSEGYYNITYYKEYIIDIASNIEIDLGYYYSIWIQIDPLNKTIYKNNYHFILGVYNQDYIDVKATLE